MGTIAYFSMINSTSVSSVGGHPSWLMAWGPFLLIDGHSKQKHCSSKPTEPTRVCAYSLRTCLRSAAFCAGRKRTVPRVEKGDPEGEIRVSWGGAWWTSVGLTNEGLKRPTWKLYAVREGSGAIEQKKKKRLAVSAAHRQVANELERVRHVTGH